MNNIKNVEEKEESIKVTTKMAFALLGLIKKINIREHLIAVSKEQMKLTTSKDNLFRYLYSRNENKDEEITEEVTMRLLNENVDIAKEIADIDEKLNDIGLNFTFDLMDLAHDNETEFNKTMSVVFGISEKEAENKPLDEVADVFMSIFKCKAFQGLSKKMNK
ncbi:hypothetical protein D4A35_01825 [Paraclostridium bifermentans]|uniref:Uncharacterized protein n=1 Tax=Paraclostridium bifermentans TaxID=1490 RepID=A0A5P3XEI4_PARBF|nr:hypothetical protein [Paraclostridium bifermentans]QEZ67731.1 hypothetical protein D4A35_01825 [Paraclostridium bifermentans]